MGKRPGLVILCSRVTSWTAINWKCGSPNEPLSESSGVSSVLGWVAALYVCLTLVLMVECLHTPQLLYHLGFFPTDVSLVSFATTSLPDRASQCPSPG